MPKSSLNTNNFNGNYHLLKTKLFGITVILFLAVKILITLFLPQRPTLATDLTVNNILLGINQQRQLFDLTTLNTNLLLTEAAQYKTDDMQARHYFAHVDPDGHYIWDKIVALGYTPYLQLGENLAINFYDTDSLINAWMNSPEHRANILNGGFRDQGMGLTLGNVAQGQYYSAIGNTFGTLAKTAQAKSPAAAQSAAPIPGSPAPATKEAAPPAQPSTAPTGNASSAAPPSGQTPQGQTTSAKNVQQPQNAILPRENQNLTYNSNSSFALPQQPTATTATAAASSANNQPATAVVGQQNQNVLNNYTANRYLILFCGALLLVLLLSDLKKAMASKLGHLDKKTNNLVLLVLALLVVAFMYWF